MRFPFFSFSANIIFRFAANHSPRSCTNCNRTREFANRVSADRCPRLTGHIAYIYFAMIHFLSGTSCSALWCLTYCFELSLITLKQVSESRNKLTLRLLVNFRKTWEMRGQITRAAERCFSVLWRIACICMRITSKHSLITVINTADPQNMRLRRSNDASKA